MNGCGRFLVRWVYLILTESSIAELTMTWDAVSGDEL